jgi:pyrroline-5-carboxylate reductase
LREKMRNGLEGKRVAVLGLGKLGGILVQAFLERGLVSPGNVRASVRHERRVSMLRDETGIEVGTDNRSLAEWADLLLLCVKPKNVIQVVSEIGSLLTSGQLVISVAASVSTVDIESSLPTRVPVVRAMPNTPCAVGSGMTAICRGRHANEEHLEQAKTLFEAVGRSVVLDENHFDAVTGLSASGPAFIYIILESLAEAGVKVGLPRDVATLLAAQTALGASQVVLETASHPALLKDAVTTPAGCTIDGILELEEGKLRVTLIKAVVKATERARSLVNG